MFSKVSKNSIGLYVGDGFLRFMELKNTKDGFALGVYGEIPIRKELPEKEVLQFLNKNFKSKPIHFSVGHEYMSKLQEYLSLFKSVGMKIKSFEHHTESLARSVLKKGDIGTYMIVDFRKNNKNILIVSAGAVKFLSNSDFDGNIMQAKNEIAKHFIEWHLDEDKIEHTEPIQKIIISGTELKLPELSEYLSVNLRNNVEVANVWRNILDTSKRVPEISFEDSFNFAHALGLALKGL